MVDKLRPDELAAFKSAFDMFDKNADGTISTKVENIIISFRKFHIALNICLITCLFKKNLQTKFIFRGIVYAYNIRQKGLAQTTF